MPNTGGEGADSKSRASRTEPFVVLANPRSSRSSRGRCAQNRRPCARRSSNGRFVEGAAAHPSSEASMSAIAAATAAGLPWRISCPDCTAMETGSELPSSHKAWSSWDPDWPFVAHNTVTGIAGIGRRSTASWCSKSGGGPRPAIGCCARREDERSHTDNSRERHGDTDTESVVHGGLRDQRCAVSRRRGAPSNRQRVAQDTRVAPSRMSISVPTLLGSGAAGRGGSFADSEGGYRALRSGARCSDGVLIVPVATADDSAGRARVQGAG
ncbi:hypothetical protein EV279_0988 [Microbacterium sp. BK668]|nr:hypothetical protein EV279_0988 [Microbacterium sp. BK668]